ncbi:MAG TPA: M48 family metallopeptidase, partial [Bacteroidia bacterium]|nr:M48 family metallopeptidase [Bacteroidia bacterium]
MKNISSAVLILLFPAALFAQVPNMDNYTPARSGGILPKDFLISTAEKYQLDKQKIDTDDVKMQEAEEEFYLQNNYSIDELRFSGQCLVNDTMGMYVNRVADSLLLKQDPVLRSQIKFYVLRSSAVNAFTTDQGVIFVTMGLLTRLHNESELAYVLAHEVIHYKRHHVLVGYKEGVKAQQGIGQYEATTFENRFLKKHRYARGQESQADEEGFDLLVNSNYDPHAAIAAFDILALADAPFADTAFSKSFFETDHLVFPSKYQPDTVKAIKPQNEDEDDDLATHPSVYKRRKAIVHKFSKLDPKDTTGSLFLNDKAMFWKVKTMARFEEADEHLNDQEYDMAIYSDYANQRVYPSNHYLTKEMVRALYAEVIDKNRSYDFSDLGAMFSLMYGNTNDDKPIGEQGRLTSFMNKTDATGWNVLALNYAWQAHLQYPDDKDIFTWCYGLSRELAVKNEVKLKDFMTSDSAFIAIGNKAMEDTAIAHKVKVNTPAGRFQAAIDHLDRDSLSDYHYWQFAFVDEMKDSAF